MLVLLILVLDILIPPNFVWALDHLVNQFFFVPLSEFVIMEMEKKLDDGGMLFPVIYNTDSSPNALFNGIQ